MSTYELRESPNGVDHLIVRGHCATCGLGPHDEWPGLRFEPDTAADAIRVGLAESRMS